MKILLILLLAVAAVQAFPMKKNLEQLVLSGLDPNLKNTVAGDCPDGFQDTVFTSISACEGTSSTDEELATCLRGKLSTEVPFSVLIKDDHNYAHIWIGDVICYGIFDNAGDKNNDYIIWKNKSRE